MRSDSANEKLSVASVFGLSELAVKSVLHLFRSRPLATGRRVVYDNFSTHSKEIA
jgi:hypothetical protein